MRQCLDCRTVEGSEQDNPVTALLGRKPCKGFEWRGHRYAEHTHTELTAGCFACLLVATGGGN